MRHRVPLVVAASAALVLLAAPAAQAADPDEVGYYVEWESTNLYQLDLESGAPTLVGTTDVEAITGLDVDEDGTGYAVDFGVTPATLYAVDVNEGTITPVVPLSYADTSSVSNCTGLDYTGGVISVACDAGGSDVGTVDPETGVFTPFVEGGERVASLATDPTTGILYGFSYSGSVVSYEGGEEEDLAVPTGPTFYGADFSADGSELWVAYDGELAEGTTLLGWSVHGIPMFTDEGFTENLTVSVAAAAEEEPEAEPSLPDTGADAAPLALAAGAALLGGVALLAARRRIRRVEG